MKDLGITKGVFTLGACANGGKILIFGEYRLQVLNIPDAILFADAGTTANQCGLLPSELLEQRNDLLEALQEMLDSGKNESFDLIKRTVGSRGISSEEAICKSIEAISKALNKQP